MCKNSRSPDVTCKNDISKSDNSKYLHILIILLKYSNFYSMAIYDL